MSYSVLGSIVLYSLFLLSCNRHIDKVKNERKYSVMQGEFIYTPEKNVLRYRSKIGVRMDDITLSPRSFEVSVPKGLEFYSFLGPSDFYFYYDAKQSVYIHINLEDSTSKIDTSYTPTSLEIGNIINHVGIGRKEKYNIGKIDFLENRKQAILKKGAATILLYNIKQKNYDTFFNYLNGFQFIK